MFQIFTYTFKIVGYHNLLPQKAFYVGTVYKEPAIKRYRQISITHFK